MSDDLPERVTQAIQAVEIPESGWPEDRPGVWVMALDEAVKAADAALAEIGAVRVKPLVWEDYPVKDAPILTRAVTPNGTYFICDDTDDFTGLYCEFVSYKDATWYGTVRPSTTVICDHQHVDDPATLKAAAQADYERRILAAIEPATVSVREAARPSCGVMASQWEGDTYPECGTDFSAALRAIAEGKE